MERKPVGSKEWFSEPLSDTDKSDPDYEDMHDSYNSVTDTVDEAYLYRRNQSDTKQQFIKTN